MQTSLTVLNYLEYSLHFLLCMRIGTRLKCARHMQSCSKLKRSDAGKGHVLNDSILYLSHPPCLALVLEQLQSNQLINDSGIITFESSAWKRKIQRTTMFYAAKSGSKPCPTSKLVQELKHSLGRNGAQILGGSNKVACSVECIDCIVRQCM